MTERRPPGDTAGRHGWFRTRESLVALTVLGLILSIAVAGEMLRLDVKPDAAAAWFAFAGLVLFGAQVFSDILGRAVAKRSEASQRELQALATRDLAILIGPIGVGLLLLASRAVGIEAEDALLTTIVTGLVVVGGLSYYAAAAYRPWRRILLATAVVVFCALIVIAENVV